MSSRSTFYFNGNSIISSSAIYTDSTLTTIAPDGFYSDGNNSVKQEGGVTVEIYTCETCGCLAQSVNENSSASGVYKSDLVLGQGTGAVTLKITVNATSAPIGFRALESFNNTSTQNIYNRIVNFSDGITDDPTYSFTYPPQLGRFVHIGNSQSGVLGGCCSALGPGGADCFTGTSTSLATNKLIDSTANFSGNVTIGDIVINNTTNATAIVTVIDSNTQLTLDANIFTNDVAPLDLYTIQKIYDVYDWDGNCFIDSSINEGQALYHNDVFLIEYASKTTPEEWYMVVPKTTATRSTLVMQAFASCTPNNWEVEVGCPTALTPFAISDAGNTTCREVGFTAYSAPVTGTAGAPGLWDFVFSDSNGLTPYPDGTYVIINSTGKYITITNGVITFLGATCT